MKEMREECREFESQKEERHQKRMERLQRQAKQNGRNGDGNGSLRPQAQRLQSSSSPDLRYAGSGGPIRYIDDNPYNGTQYTDRR